MYVILLHDGRRADPWGLYVGQTSRDPDWRFDQHKSGYKASGAARRFGIRLLPDLVRHLNPLKRWEALEVEAGLAEVRMSDEVLQATLKLREFLFEAVYENPRATAEFEKATGILGGLWEKVRARPEQYLDAVTIEKEGLDAAARDFLAGMTDRYAVSLFQELFVPRSWSV